MAAIKIFTAEKNDCDVRISRFVESVTKNMPASLMYKSFRNKRVKVNGKAVSPDYRIALGDEIRLYINDEFFPGEAGDNNTNIKTTTHFDKKRENAKEETDEEEKT